MVATIGFAILFSAPKKEIVLCGVTGAIGWVIYCILTQYGLNKVFACVIATVVLTVFSRALAIIRKNPATVYLTAGIFPLVPGAGIYYTAYYLVNSDKAMFSAKGLETFETAAAVGFGILMGFAIPQKMLRYLFGKRK
jgi:uncharacterized membrane protein YjjB (DUF3815 family)